jgi:hypothetical protein
MSLRIFDSKILLKCSHKKLIELCEFPLGQKWNLLYRASEHGFSAENFHSKCDNHANTLTVIKSTNGNIFGGYTEQMWSSTDKFKTDNNAFIYSLVNKDKNPVKMKVQEPQNAIYCDSKYGPCFGQNDINMEGNLDSDETSLSNLGLSYEYPTHDFDSKEANCFLAGSHRFQAEELEVFKASEFSFE